MKIPQIRFLSPLDKAINLLKIIESSGRKTKPTYNQIGNFNAKYYSEQRINSGRNECLKALNHDKFDKEKI